MQVSARSCSSTTNGYNFETLKVQKPKEWVFHVEMNRPDKLNAMNEKLWREIGVCFNKLADDADCRVVVLSGAGRLFTAGLDLQSNGLFEKMSGEDDVARRAKLFRKEIQAFQDSFSTLEKCPKPVISAIHGACIGGGVDLICSADIRYCTKDAWFQIKEVEIGLAADVGTLQRLPKIVGNDGLVRELAYTARKVSSDEALNLGLVSKVFDNKEALMNSVFELAALIASKSPVAVQGTKVNLNYSRNHSIPDSLHFMAHWNMTMLQSEDLMKAAMGVISKSSEPPEFSKL